MRTHFLLVWHFYAAVAILACAKQPFLSPICLGCQLSGHLSVDCCCNCDWDVATKVLGEEWNCGYVEKWKSLPVGPVSRYLSLFWANLTVHCWCRCQFSWPFFTHINILFPFQFFSSPLLSACGRVPQIAQPCPVQKKKIKSKIKPSQNMHELDLCRNMLHIYFIVLCLLLGTG